MKVLLWRRGWATCPPQLRSAQLPLRHSSRLAPSKVSAIQRPQRTVPIPPPTIRENSPPIWPSQTRAYTARSTTSSASTPPPTGAAAAAATTTTANPEEPPPLSERPPSYELTFTCKPCRHRSTHNVTKRGYHHGAVLITCPGCKNRHVISDHLGYFADRNFTIEDLMRRKGEFVRKGTLGSEGDVEFWDDGTETQRGREGLS